MTRDGIEAQANYYRNLHLRYRDTIAVVHVEGEDDKRFWNAQLQNLYPGKYYFVAQSKSREGQETRGCEQCLRFRPYLNRQFFICIDSDLRELRGEEDFTSANFIAQTHTYSWENHSCEAKHLTSRLSEKVKDANFDLVSFLSELSSIVYEPLRYLVYYQGPELNKLWNITKFNSCLPTQLKREELEDNGRLYLEKIRGNFETVLASVKIPKDFSIDGLDPHNAYLHIQGHQLYKLLTNLGTLLCKGKRVAFKTEVLDGVFPVSGYAEIDKVQGDLRIILGAKKDEPRGLTPKGGRFAPGEAKASSPL